MSESKTPELAAGWGLPGRSKKAHYFCAGSMRSLCTAWVYAGTRYDTNHDSVDNCAACKKRLKVLKPDAKT